MNVYLKQILGIIIGAVGSVFISVVISAGLNFYFNQNLQVFGWTNWIYISNLISFSIAMYTYSILIEKRIIGGYSLLSTSLIFGLIITLFTVTFGKVISMYILEGHSFLVTLAAILDSFIISVLVLYLPITIGCYAIFKVYNSVIKKG